MQEAQLIDVNYKIINNNTIIELLCKDTKFFNLYDKFDAYFYVDGPITIKNEIEQIAINNNTKIKRIETVKKKIKGKLKNILKIVCITPSDISKIKKGIERYPCYEHKIRFKQKYINYKKLSPLHLFEYSSEGEGWVTELNPSKKSIPLNFKCCAFDIETYTPTGLPKPIKEPVLMISYSTDKESKVISYKKSKHDYVETVKTENKMIETFCDKLNDLDIEVLYGYNSANFDLDYLNKRSQSTGAYFGIGRNESPPRINTLGRNTIAKIDGRIHIDLYPISQSLGRMGAIDAQRFRLQDVYKAVTGTKSITKELINKSDIWKVWDAETDDLELLFEYSLGDSVMTKLIGDKILPIEIEVSKASKTTLFDVTNASSSRLVENLLMYYSNLRNEIIPNIPSGSEIIARLHDQVQGAYVKMPKPGIYDNLVVFDFRSLYPSIIISHNVDPNTLNCTCCTDKEKHISPLSHKFCSKNKGLVPEVLEELISTRIKLKEKLKQTEKNSTEYNELYPRVQALKILANSFYGYLLYSRSRWYTREGGESITAWARYYIKQTIEKAEKNGFEVIYSDTDSTFLLMSNKTKNETLKLLGDINATLPSDMKLDLEGFYPRGLFVAKKTRKTGAKKKYALIDEAGNIKIRGFELVRRDWSNVAKKTQKEILTTILKEGDKDKALNIVKDVIKQIRKGDMDLNEFVIFNKIRKPINDYKILSPEVHAAKQLIEKGKEIHVGSLVGYIITDIKSKNISDKAVPYQYAKTYDIDYYVNKQVIPAVLKILEELGVEESELKGEGKQIGLNYFF